MKLKTIKTEAEIAEAIATKIAGRKMIEVTSVNGAVKGVRIGAAHFSMEAYSFVVHAETDREQASRYRLTAKAAGFPDAVSYHESLSDANAAKDRFSSDTDTAVASVNVWLDGAGEVISEVDAEPAKSINNEDDLPF